MYILILFTVTAVIVISIMSPENGLAIRKNISGNLITMVKIFPLVFILIGLFRVWIKKEKVEKHLGRNAGPISYLWAILMGGTTIGPMIVALPVAAALHKKGARLSILFAYISSAAVCRVPMTFFETTYLGIKFTIIRYCVSIPLIILTSIMLGNFLENTNYKIKED
ncbi:MAG: hypothetical protein GY760_27075 [Deltaproteobacteria bacterium]|nr:hypothetical protein [Deltaproteobacteria bacterium]